MQAIVVQALKLLRRRNYEKTLDFANILPIGVVKVVYKMFFLSIYTDIAAPWSTDIAKIGPGVAISSDWIFDA